VHADFSLPAGLGHQVLALTTRSARIDGASQNVAMPTPEAHKLTRNAAK
jgi:hypothetical protein